MDLKLIRDKLVGSEEQRAVSPVIGVILMVAITVILAAVIATFVMDIGDLDDSAPNAQFEWENTSDSSDDKYTVTHVSGENFDNSSIEFGGTSASDIDTVSTKWDGEVSAGDEMVIEFDDTPEDLSLVYEADGSSSIITEYDG